MRECDELIFLQASYQDSDLGLDKADPVGNEILGSLHVKSIYTECYCTACLDAVCKVLSRLIVPIV